MQSTQRKFSKIKNMLSKVKEITFDILWPKKCIVCGCIISVGQKAAICDDCISGVKKQSAVFVEPDRYFDEAVCALPYEGNVRMAMMNYKFHSKRYICHGFTRALYEVLKDRDFVTEFDCICPVPIHPLREREYNQSLLIAAELSKLFDIKICPDLLVKIKNLAPLSTMGYVMRKAMVKGAVDFNVKYDITNKKILLLDDIYTTGSTADECSKILKMHGAESVKVIAACHRDKKGENEYANADNIGY
ncbi:MAG: ComF family protein [Ruminococcaceae bacterium]|nr:ComF family protein [Oscillospiraceae bacterium]